MGEPIDEWLLRCKLAIEKDEVELLVTAVWAIFYGRNKGVFQRSFTPSNNIVASARRHLEDFRVVVVEMGSGSHLRRDSSSSTLMLLALRAVGLIWEVFCAMRLAMWCGCLHNLLLK